MYTLGISAYYHDSAACILKDGRIIAALEEERFSRITYDNTFPKKAISRCLDVANIKFSDINKIAYYEKPLLKLERVLETLSHTWPMSLRQYLDHMPSQLSHKITIQETLKHEFGCTRELYYIPHHLSHAAASYFTSPYKEAAVVIIDGVGEWATTSLWHAQANQLTLEKQIDFPHSIGLFYATITSYLGFLR
jgi:carbamoyltransferase